MNTEATAENGSAPTESNYLQTISMNDRLKRNNSTPSLGTRFEERNTSSVLPSELSAGSAAAAGFTPSNIGLKEQRIGASYSCAGPEAEVFLNLRQADKENMLDVLKTRVKSQLENVQERLMKLEEQGVIKIND